MNYLLAPSVKNIKSLIFLLTGFIILFLPFISAYPLEEALVIKDRINVRVDATVLAPSLGFLKKGERVSVAEERFEWIKIILPKRFSVYASSQFFKKISDNKVEAIASDLNLRSSPSISSYIIGKADKGEVFLLKRQGKEWVELRGYPYAYGWVNKNFLQKLEKVVIAEGVILPFKKSYCEANCVLKAADKKYFLNLLYRGKTKFMNKKVKIEGVKMKGACSYVVVQKVAFIK